MSETERKVVRIAMRGSGLASLYTYRAGVWSAEKMRESWVRGRTWWRSRRRDR